MNVFRTCKQLLRLGQTTQTLQQGLIGSLIRLQSTQAQTLSLKETLHRIVPEKQKEVAEFRKEYGDKSLGEYTVDQVYGGMRGIKGLVTETSHLDSNEGIEFRGYTIPQCQELLPKAEGGEEPLPEGIFWLLMTGEIPTKAQVDNLSKEWVAHADLPQHVVQMLNNFPETLHPMSQFSAAITAMNSESKFAKAYAQGVPKADYWEYVFDDAMDLTAKITTVAAYIYRNVFKDGKVAPVDPNKDWADNLASMLGFEDPMFHEMMRLYLVLHADHEGGNVSAHTTHLVGSALSDPYLCLAAGMNGLAGPLHGLANQEVLIWITNMLKEVGEDPSDEKVKEFVLLWLRVIQQREDPRDLSHYEPNWFQFLAVVCLIAWTAGMAFGLYNWFSIMEPYYENATLALISNVSTRSSRGGQFIDVAALEFTPSTDVNESLTMAYKDGRSYCVAPITTAGPPKAAPPAFYEFWAVGVDCCSPFEPKVFMCGEPNDDEARGGFRWTDSSQIPNFRKAIQQAQEEYKIRAGENLIFLHWTGDPVAKINEKSLQGWANFRLAVAVYLALSIVLMLLEVGHQKYS